MIMHEVAGVLIASLMVVAFATALNPNSQMAQILTSSASGWAGILGAAGGRSVQFPGGVQIGAG